MINWLKGMFREQNGEPSSRRAMFVLVIVATLVFLGYHLYKHGLDAFWADITKVLIGITGGSVAVGRFAENKPAE